MNPFPDLIRAARKARGLTQTELARATGRRSGQSITDAEKGNYLCPNLACDLSAVLGIDLEPFGVCYDARHGADEWREPDYTQPCATPGCLNLRDDKAYNGWCRLCFQRNTVPLVWLARCKAMDDLAAQRSARWQREKEEARET